MIHMENDCLHVIVNKCILYFDITIALNMQYLEEGRAALLLKWKSTWLIE